MYKFKSKAAGDLIMTAPVGDQALRIIGKEPATQGIIEPAAMPAAIAALEAAIAMEQSGPQQVDVVPAADPSDDASGENVTLRQRAWPLVAMLKRAHAANVEIVRGV